MNTKNDQKAKEDWIEECHDNFYKVAYKVKERLFCGKSPFQKVEVVETAGHGKMLFNDNLAMISEKDEFAYHDMISHVPLFTHPNPKRVLVIGGGDGGTAREVLRHDEVDVCDMVEIDAMVVDACKEFIPQTAHVFSNPRLNLIIADAVKYVKETDQTYDVILVDSTDPIGPATPLFGPEFYSNIYNRLSDNGIVVSQGESPYYEVEVQKSMLKILGDFFPLVTLYNYSNLTYPGGLWSFTLASKGLHPINDFDSQRFRDSKLKCSYYNEEIHRGCQALPEFMMRNYEGLLKRG